MIIFLGLAGSGKSTQGQRLAKRLDCPWLSTGQLLRSRVKDKATLNKMISGEMISDNVLLPYLEKELMRMEAHNNEIVLDGSPRSLKQAKWLIDMTIKHGIKITAAVHLTARESLVKKRLIKRGRPDDHEIAIRQRFAEYELTILPILAYIRDQGVRVFNIDGERSEEAVEAEINEKLQIR